MKRQGNKPAHILAKHAKGIDNFVTWIEESPPIIESIVIQDALYLSSSWIKLIYFPSKKEEEKK